MSEEERAIDRLLVQELVQRRDQKTPEKFHFIKTGTIHSAAITYESWLQSVYCYMYIKSAAELKMSPQRSLRTNLRRSPRAPLQSSRRTLLSKSAADFVLHGGLPFWWTCGIESTRIGLRKSTGQRWSYAGLTWSLWWTWWIRLGSTQVDSTVESNLVQLEPRESASDPRGVEADSSPPVRAQNRLSKLRCLDDRQFYNCSIRMYFHRWDAVWNVWLYYSD